MARSRAAVSSLVGPAGCGVGGWGASRLSAGAFFSSVRLRSSCCALACSTVGRDARSTSDMKPRRSLLALDTADLPRQACRLARPRPRSRNLATVAPWRRKARPRCSSAAWKRLPAVAVLIEGGDRFLELRCGSMPARSACCAILA